MAMSSHPFLLLVISLSIIIYTNSKPLLNDVTSPYLSPTTLFKNYDKMLKNFRIYIYKPSNPLTFNTQPESLFYKSLLHSSFVTQDPEQAHLFFVPFPNMSTRSLSRLVKDLRINFPFWNRTLGADHFYLSRTGIGYAADRNVLELKKNAIQISSFPTIPGNFIPHKDITLPPPNPGNDNPLDLLSHAAINTTQMFYAFGDNRDGRSQIQLVNEMNNESRLAAGRFCLIRYSIVNDEMSWLGEVLRLGCLPVVITDRPIQDLPFMDLLRWSDIAVFVGAKQGEGELNKIVKKMIDGKEENEYGRMRDFGMKVSQQHFTWNEIAEPYDAFHMVMYQLWLRRHTIRYARREWDDDEENKSS
ncbi:probable glycosyltransferase At3g07620 [Impatiens glandulifera]|uniref:probable glycosyltransferase At3g07620 n=1 Tax=Impatiens glandulifera TaxID=253017 RepID=UPI001FB08892|nr:probable glycosyltransferase At3g07620 [Impatiens glandulifera]